MLTIEKSSIFQRFFVYLEYQGFYVAEVNGFHSFHGGSGSNFFRPPLKEVISSYILYFVRCWGFRLGAPQ